MITKTVASWDGALVSGLRLARRTLEAARSLVEEGVVEQDAARPVAGVGVAVHHGAVPGVALQPTDEARVLHLPGTVAPAGTPPLPAAPPLATRTLVHGPLHVAHGALGVDVGLRFLESVVAGGLGRGAELVRQHHHGDARHVRQEGLGGDGRVAVSVSLFEDAPRPTPRCRASAACPGRAWRAVDVVARGCSSTLAVLLTL